MYSSLQAILSEDKKLTVTSAPPVSEGENNSVSVTVSLPSDTDFTDTEIYLEFLCASGERFITPNLNPSLSASPVVSYLLKSGALSSSGRCYIQITLVKGDVISKSVLDENSSFLVLPSVNASVSDYEITTLFSAYASALESMSAGVDALMQSLGETKTQLETYSEQISDIITAAENGEFDGAKGDKGDKGDDGEDFSVDKWFSSVAEMNNDTSLSVGDIAGILYTSSGDGGKIYVKTAVGFSYISQLSGVKGDTGPAPSITVSVSSLPAGSQPSVTKSAPTKIPTLPSLFPKATKAARDLRVLPDLKAIPALLPIFPSRPKHFLREARQQYRFQVLRLPPLSNSVSPPDLRAPRAIRATQALRVSKAIRATPA